VRFKNKALPTLGYLCWQSQIGKNEAQHFLFPSLGLGHNGQDRAIELAVDAVAADLSNALQPKALGREPYELLK
jgi:hypothetical protein